MPPRADLITLPQIEDLNRRELIAGALVAALLIGCRGDDREPTDRGETFLTHDMFGEVSVPRQAQRIIAGDAVTLGNMLALDVLPVGTAVNRNSLPDHLAGRLEGIADITAEDNSGIDLEKAATLRPDLVITYAGLPNRPFNQENCERYRQLTATFCYEYGYSTEEELKRNLTEVAHILGRESRAQELIAQYDRRVEELRRRVAAAGLTDKPISVLRVMQNEYWLTFGSVESIIFREIGLPRPENQSDYTKFGFPISLENLRDVDAYAIYVYVDSNANDALAPLVNNPLYQTLDAVKGGRVFFVSSGVWNSVEIPGAMLIMADVERTLIAPAEAR